MGRCNNLWTFCSALWFYINRKHLTIPPIEIVQRWFREIAISWSKVFYSIFCRDGKVLGSGQLKICTGFSKHTRNIYRTSVYGFMSIEAMILNRYLFNFSVGRRKIYTMTKKVISRSLYQLFPMQLAVH